MGKYYAISLGLLAVLLSAVRDQKITCCNQCWHVICGASFEIIVTLEPTSLGLADHIYMLYYRGLCALLIHYKYHNSWRITQRSEAHSDSGLHLGIMESSELVTESPQQLSTPAQLVLHANQRFVYTRGIGAIVVSILGTSVNLTVVGLILRHGVASAQNRLIVHMCINNLLNSVLVLPFLAFSQFNSAILPNIIPSELCIVSAFALYVIQGMALLSLTFISLNRYFVVLCPKNRACTFGGKWRTSAILMGTWVYSTFMVIPALLGIWGEFGFEPVLGVCTLMRNKREQDKYYAVFLSVLGFAVPLCIMVGCYTRILWVVYQQGRKIGANSGNSSLLEGHRRTEMALTWLSLRLVVTFILLNLP